MAKQILRHLSSSFELREAGDGGESGILVGVVTTYDSPYEIGFGWREQIHEGAFAESLERQGAIPVYLQHNHRAAPLGVARMVPGEAGALTMRAELFLDHPDAMAAYRAAQQGALREWSIGFYYGDEDAGDVQVDRKNSLISVRKGDLAEVSLVVRGANPDTKTLDVRSLVEVQPEAPSTPTTDPDLDDLLIQLYS